METSVLLSVWGGLRLVMVYATVNYSAATGSGGLLSPGKDSETLKPLRQAPFRARPS